MTQTLRVDLGSGVAHYEQIRAQVAAAVTAGRLRAGDRLPTVRVLAADLGIATGTIARAYRELEAAGWVTTRRRHGTVVADREPSGGSKVGEAALRLVVAARAERLSDQDVHDLVSGALLAHSEPPPGRPRVVVGSGPTPNDPGPSHVSARKDGA